MISTELAQLLLSFSVKVFHKGPVDSIFFQKFNSLGKCELYHRGFALERSKLELIVDSF